MSDVAANYLKDFAADHAPKTTVSARGSFKHILKHLAGVLVPDLTEARIRAYITARQAEGAGNRSINLEVAELSRALGRTWRELWSKINKLSENSDVGRALSHDEESRLLAAASAVACARSPIHVLLRLALWTGMRSAEITQLTWAQVDLIWQGRNHALHWEEEEPKLRVEECLEAARCGFWTRVQWLPSQQLGVSSGKASRLDHLRCVQDGHADVYTIRASPINKTHRATEIEAAAVDLTAFL